MDEALASLRDGSAASMEPAGIAIAWRDAVGVAGAFDAGSFASYASDLVDVEALFDGEVLELAIVPHMAMTVEFVQIELRHAFAAHEQVLMNGYQSWTTTRELHAWGSTRGLKGVSRHVIDRFVLDGGGDYRFAEYKSLYGQLHGWTYATFRDGAGMVLLASLDEACGFTLIRTHASIGQVLLQTEPPLHAIAPGERVVLGRYAIMRGTADECYDRWFELAGIEARTRLPLVGYTSWYRHYGNISEQKLADDLAGAACAFDRLEADLETATGSRSESGRFIKLFQIDDGYCRVGDWLAVDAQKFPQGLSPLAHVARECGFVPGLWMAPFACERDSDLFLEHNDWLLRDEAGNACQTGCHWSGAYALDTRNPAVREHVRTAISTMVNEWGFGLLKLDFLYAACMIAHDGLNRGELMADAMALVREAAGEKCLIIACGVPLASAFGIADYCRIGCDVGLDWDGPLYMRMMHRERVSTKNSLANTYGRAPLDGRVFGNDPDVFFLRDDVKLSDIQRDMLLFADADLGSVLLTSDDMGRWDDRAYGRWRTAVQLLLERKTG